MKKIIIDGALLKSREKAYPYLFEALGLVFGRNLDALYDVLTDLSDTEISLINIPLMIENLGGYGEKMLTCFEDADKANPMLEVDFEQQ